MNTLETIGERIKALRISEGMSQDRLAEMLYITKPTISKYENNRIKIPSELVCAIAEALNTTPNYLLSGDEREADWLEDMITLLSGIRDIRIREMVRKQLMAVMEYCAEQ